MGLAERLVAQGLVIVLASCGATKARNAPETGPGTRTVAGLERVFAPMMQRLSVLADHVEIDCSRELWDRFVRPVDSVFHEVKRLEGPPVAYTFKNLRGGIDMPLDLKVGRQTYIILKSAVVRLHSRGPARFDMKARGGLVVQRPGAPAKQVIVLSCSNGRWEEKP